MNEQEIKSSLALFLRPSDNDLVVTELPICFHSARVDVAVIDGTLSGYEIKGHRDSLARLPNQIFYYDQVFRFSTLAADARHIPLAGGIAPDHWGLIRIERELAKFEWVRLPKPNTKIDAMSVAGLLWRGELIELLSEVGEDVTGKVNSRKKLRQLLVSRVKSDLITTLVATKIKARLRWRVGARPA
ncbi:MAG: sce7726 family protein [Planctomycetota bacterium]